MWSPPLIRNVSILAVCQAMFFMANTMLISTSPLVGLSLAPMHAMATLPLGFQFLGAMVTALPASYLMRAVGRRHGLAFGCLFGFAAGICAASAVMLESFLLFIGASALYGMFSAFCQFYRFTASDAADRSDPSGKARPRAISLVLAGGVVAAVLGPETAKLTKELVAGSLFAGCYFTIAGLALLSAVGLLALDLPRMSEARSERPARSALEIFRQPMAITAVVSAIVSYVTMNLIMTATPLAMQAEGHLFDNTAFVIQWHVLGMFVPSFFTGSLIGRFGEYRMIAAGALLLLVAVAVNLSGVHLIHFTLALGLLGIGWNFMFIGGTTLLTRCYEPSEKAKAQGMNDLLLFSMVAMSASASGALHDTVGWSVMNMLAIPLLLACLVLAWTQMGSAARKVAAS
ncbi:MAG: MFS transporter [Geminicoccaceae bacterium]|nr:MFS transporter [Geminicoccaceae bacterium]MCB9942247.1 MFS transporter [Geminicoccaceae bacterium]